jgi:hypothetical protein
MFFIRSPPMGLQIICDYFSHTIFSCGVNELIDCEVVDCLSVQVHERHLSDNYQSDCVLHNIWTPVCSPVSWFNREDSLSLTMTLYTCANSFLQILQNLEFNYICKLISYCDISTGNKIKSHACTMKILNRIYIMPNHGSSSAFERHISYYKHSLPENLSVNL